MTHQIPSSETIKKTAKTKAKELDITRAKDHFTPENPFLSWDGLVERVSHARTGDIAGATAAFGTAITGAYLSLAPALATAIAGTAAASGLVLSAPVVTGVAGTIAAAGAVGTAFGLTGTALGSGLIGKLTQKTTNYFSDKVHNRIHLGDVAANLVDKEVSTLKQTGEAPSQEIISKDSQKAVRDAYIRGELPKEFDPSQPWSTIGAGAAVMSVLGGITAIGAPTVGKAVSRIGQASEESSHINANLQQAANQLQALYAQQPSPSA